MGFDFIKNQSLIFRYVKIEGTGKGTLKRNSMTFILQSMLLLLAQALSNVLGFKQTMNENVLSST